MSTNRLVDLVNDLLDVAARGGRRASRSTGAPTDVGEVVREVATLLRPRIDDKGQQLELERRPTTCPPALADPARLRQMLTNLLTNAHLYTRQGRHARRSACARPAGTSRSRSPTPAAA